MKPVKNGILVCLSFADVHVHLREPGFTAKETILTGTRAAARGGYTLVCPMPNLNPVPDAPETLAIELEAIRKDAVVRVFPYCSITKGRKGLELVDFATLKGSCCAFSDDGSGVQSEAVMLEAMKAAAREGVIIAAHCEDNTLPGVDPRSEWGQIERDLALCARTGCHYHVCHISSRESVRLIREAKARGVNVTCETAPHYLTLCNEDVKDEGRFKMNPPIREAADRDALIEGLLDGTIDMIVTDHAPHSFDEKAKGLEGSAMGVVGLECAFRVLHDRLIRSQKVLSLEKLVELMSLNPRRRFNIPGGIEPGQRADITVIDPEKCGVIDPRTFFSMGTATPFDGWETTGDVVMTMAGGKIAWEAERK